ncbi:DNA/RNA helicase domain-containing protein [Bacillus sp. OV166]|uniref:DNA/RNA helicase domain-containing protein n=1 Tax=Bacillus sp. OV166 TaxID=1882763 RepID=UPI000B4418AC|nr:DNA/RNA helicase domain-containing protein [Bacillus sp. OV166]
MYAYFNHPDSAYFSSRLNHYATEFQTQRLELDLGILLWGYDFRIENGQWVNYYQDRRLKNPYQIRKNSYRVLLTRGRDGTILVIPNDPRLDDTYDLFVSLGVPVLK